MFSKQLFPAPGVRRRFGSECFLLSLGDFAFRLFDRWFVQSWDELELAAPAAALGRKIFSQRIALRVIFWQQNPPQIRMARKADAHHVVDFPLEELCALPDGGHGGNRRIVLGQAGLHAEPAMVRERVQMIHDLKPLPVLRVVYRADIRQMVKRGVGRIVKKPCQIENALSRHLDGHLRACRIRLDGQHRLRKPRHQRFNQRFHDYFTNTFSRWIFSCSFKSPSIKASGRGGQPGTYTSTGTIWSTPCTTA